MTIACAANANLTPSAWLWAFLKQYERFRPTAYKPLQSDKWTCGWGHTGPDVTSATVCTQAQAQDWLEQDVAAAVADVLRLVTVPLNQNQFDALVSLRFNAGVAPLLKTLGSLLNAGNYTGAAGQFKRWDWSAGVEIPGLEARRVAEAAHFQLAA